RSSACTPCARHPDHRRRWRRRTRDSPPRSYRRRDMRCRSRSLRTQCASCPLPVGGGTVMRPGGRVPYDRIHVPPDGGSSPWVCGTGLTYAVAVTSFKDLGLSSELLAALAALGYEEPTAIQREAIPPLLEGKDLIGQAATGTGKTAAFALPLLQRIVGTPRAPARCAALVLVPTRELAMQVAEAVHRYGRAQGVVVLSIYGGQAYEQQLRALRRGVDVVVATPGRALDHLRRSTFQLDAVKLVVLDEADEMLDMGFADDIEAVLAQIPVERQTALFSATIPDRIATIAAIRSGIRSEEHTSELQSLTKIV